MGLEILIISVPIPFLFWMWHLYKIITDNSRNDWLYLISGILYMSLFIFPIENRQFFIQGLYFSGFFYMPYHLLVFFTVNGLDLIVSEIKKSRST